MKFGKSEPPGKKETPSANVSTSGNYSPGIVYGNFINQTVVKQEAVAKRRTWRALDSATFPPLGDTKAAKLAVWDSFLHTVAEMYGQQPYTEFTILVNADEVVIEGEQVPRYVVVSYQPGLCSNALKEYRQFVQLYHAWRNAQPGEARTTLEQEQKKRKARLQEWSPSIQVPSSPSWTPIQCICDGAGKRLTLHVVPKPSLAPTDYPDHLATSRELLQFLGSYSNLNLAFVGNAGWAANNYSLMKLTIAVLDRNLDMGRVRIAVDDPNEWDYINGEFDEEVRRFGNKAS
jgi:hypothetical protein